MSVFSSQYVNILLEMGWYLQCRLSSMGLCLIISSSLGVFSTNSLLLEKEGKVSLIFQPIYLCSHCRIQVS